jgi:hypothetical protein
LVAKLGPPSTTIGEQASVDPSFATPAQPLATRARSIEPERELQRVRKSRLFEKWQSGVLSERDLIHVHSLLNVFDHTPSKVRDKKMKDLERSTEDIKDDVIGRFLADVRKSYPTVFAHH